MVNLDKPALPARRAMTVDDFAPAVARVSVRKSSATVRRHLDAIAERMVSKTNVIGLRKLYATEWRTRRGYSVGPTASAVTLDDIRVLSRALLDAQPVVFGELHDSGLRVLQSSRYRKRFTATQLDIIGSIECFRLVRFDDVDRGHFIPVYRACAPGRSFLFRVIPWQSANAYGLESGPTVIHD